MSDLHIGINEVSGEHFAASYPLYKLRDTINKYQGLNTENKNWSPDYLVIAGDLVEQCNDANYTNIKSKIDNIINTFNIRPFNVIIAPGNHDVQTDHVDKHNRRSLKYKYKKRVKIFNNICNSTNINEEDFLKFIQELKNAFEPYTRFYKNYTIIDNSSTESDYYSDLFNNDDIKYTSGLKAFLLDHICFLSINTEWLYTRSSIAKSRPTVFPLIVRDIFRKINISYPDYTIVTVMHRNPHDLSWEQKNVSDSINNDALDLIEEYSDIIISGHDHPIKILPPNMIMNRSQHFQLGSVSRVSNINENTPYSASLIRIDPINLNVEFINMEYHKNDFHKLWTIIKEGQYPLFNKYRNISILDNNMFYDFDIVAKSTCLTDIKAAIESYFKIPKNTQLCINNIEEFDQKPAEEKDNYNLRISNIYNTVKNNLNRGDDCRIYWIIYRLDRNKTSSILSEIRRMFQEQILLMKIIIDIIDIAVPDRLSYRNI